MDKEKTLRKLREEIEEVRKKYGVEFAEVVRCKDCKGIGKDHFCYGWEAFVRDDDFCSYGEKRDNDGN